MSENNQTSLDEAAGLYLAALSPEEKELKQAAVLNFVRWFGRECSLNGLTAAEVGNYAERLSLSDTDYAGKLEIVRAFLTYAKKAKFSQMNLAVHLKVRKGKPRTPAASANNQRRNCNFNRRRPRKTDRRIVGIEAKATGTYCGYYQSGRRQGCTGERASGSRQRSPRDAGRTYPGNRSHFESGDYRR